jgi:hypothetical protein
MLVLGLGLALRTIFGGLGLGLEGSGLGLGGSGPGMLVLGLGLGLALRTIFGGLGLGLVPCGLINIPAVWLILTNLPCFEGFGGRTLFEICPPQLLL